MKTSLTIVAAALLLTGASLQAQVNMPAPSPTQTISQDFGMGKVEITYSRPSLKGRAVFGDNSPLAPLNKPWRTGANAATKITFSDDVAIDGKPLRAGSYTMYTVPGSAQWEVTFSKGTDYPGAAGFKATDDVLKVKVPAYPLSENVETFTVQFFNMRPETCDIGLIWGNTYVNIPVATNIKTKLGAQIEDALKGDKKPYFQAATYYYEWDKNLPKALENVNKAIGENQKAFWMHMLKARIQKEMGDVAGAKKTAATVIALAKEANNDEYQKMAQEI